jgi:hypothetical protein
MPHSTREQWLQHAVQALALIFEAKGHALPATACQVSCGFPSTGLRSHHIGQCWSRQSSGDGCNHIFISPTLGDPVEVLDTLVHELVHAVDDCAHKHGKEFKKIALAVGLHGPMRSAGAGPALRQKLQQIAQQLGPYPHGPLKLTHRKVVRTARPRAQCPQCIYTVPMLKRFLDLGPPLCPKHRVEMQAKGDWGLD